MVDLGRLDAADEEVVGERGGSVWSVCVCARRAGVPSSTGSHLRCVWVLYVYGQRPDVLEHCSCGGRKLWCLLILHGQSRREKSRSRRSRGARSRRQMSTGGPVRLSGTRCHQQSADSREEWVRGWGSRRANVVAGWSRLKWAEDQ